MYYISIKEGGHVWEKQNLITIMKGNKHYDIMKCANCSIEGKRESLESIVLKGSYTKETVYQCKGAKPLRIKQIKITRCTASGKQFSNLTSGSIHEVVEPPFPNKSDFKGVWVMGVGEPVKVLTDEYEII